MRLRPFLLTGLLCSNVALAKVSPAGVEKLEEIWQEILKSAYHEKLPVQEAPSTWQSLSLFDAGYNSKAFAHHGDIMMEGRAKLIHGFGTSIKASFIKNNNSDYTGIFEGAQNILLRVSLAVPPSTENPPKLIPGLALKVFVDGRPSLNLMAMPSLDGQYDPNIFQHDYKTNLAKPEWSVSGWILENRFAAGLSIVGQPNGSPRSFSLFHLANIAANGEVVTEAKAPFSLFLRPSKDLQSLYGAQFEEDFRSRLEGKGENMVLFRVFAEDTKGAELVEIGKLISRSNFIASEFADKKIFFKHSRMHTIEELEGSEKDPEL